jgi:hypothetical protein
MLSGIVTTGLFPLTRGSMEVFQLQPIINGLPWDLSGGSASVTLTDPNGATTILAVTITGRLIRSASWTVAAPVGGWSRQWTMTDSTGLRQVSHPLPFEVE